MGTDKKTFVQYTLISQQHLQETDVETVIQHKYHTYGIPECKLLF